MTSKRIVKTRMRGGMWEGVYSTSASQPKLEVLHQGAPLADINISPIPGSAGEWSVQWPLPAVALTDGVQTFLICEEGAAEVLDQFTLIMGVEAEEDLRAEVDLLRQELDMLKRAFRRHFHETNS